MIAFAAISCGVYGYPMDDAACIALSTTLDFLASDASIEHVTFALYDENAQLAYERTFEDLTRREQTVAFYPFG